MNLPGPAVVSDASAALLALLLAAHVFADFLFQTERVAGKKEKRIGALLEHGLVTFLTHVALLIPFLNVRVLMWLLALSVVHLIQDAIRSRAFGGRGRSLGAFLLDQVLHLCFALATWAIIVSSGGLQPGLHSAISSWLPWISKAALVASGLVFSLRGGCTVVQRVLERFPAASPDGDADRRYRMGRVIGYLERILVYRWF